MDRSITIGSFPTGSNSILCVKDNSRTSDWTLSTTNMHQLTLGCKHANCYYALYSFNQNQLDSDE